MPTNNRDIATHSAPLASFIIFVVSVFIAQSIYAAPGDEATSAQSEITSANDEVAHSSLDSAPENSEPLYFFPEDPVEPVTDQAEVQNVFRLTDDEREFLKYTLPLEEKLIEFPGPFALEYLADMENPLLELPDGEVIVVGDLVGYLFSEAKREDPRLFVANEPLLRKAMNNAIYYTALRDDAEELGLKDDLSFQALMRIGRRRALLGPLTEVAYKKYGKPVTDDDVELAYEKNKHHLFRTPLNFEAYHIFLMGYERYTTTDEDRSLRDVAKKITGSETAVSEIRVDDNRRARRWVPEHLRREYPWEPVRPGEKLLVPMDEAGMEALAGKAQRIIERLESGEDFIDVARETSDADIIEEVIRPGDEVDLLLPEIRLALRDTQVGDISPMIRTKHGFLIFKLLMKEDEKYKPLPAVKPQLEKMMRNRAQKLSLEVFRQDLLTTPLLNIDKDLLYRTANQTFLEMDQVMATFEREDGSTFEMRFRDLVPNFTRRDEYRTAKVEDRIKMVEDAFLMDDTLYNRYAEDHGITERREVFHRVDFWERMALARFYTHHHIDEKKMESTALLYDYFNRYRKEEFYRYPIFDLRVLALEFDPNDPSSREDVVQQLTFFKDTINSEARFIELVKATSIDEQTRDEGGLAKNVQGNSLTGEIGEALEEAKPGDIVGPLQLDADNAMGIVYVVARKNEFNRPFEDIFMLVAENFKKRVRENIELELRNEIIAEAEKEGKWLYPILDLEDVEQATNLPDDTEKVEPSEADTADQ